MNSQNGRCIRVKSRGQVITLGLGQFGTQSAHCFFDEIAREHNFSQPGGSNSSGKSFDVVEMPNIYFHDAVNSMCPRGIMIDTGSQLIDQMRNSPIGKVFDASNFVNGNAPSEKGFCMYKSSLGAKLVEDGLNRVRKEVEKCDSLDGFQIFHATAGGLGSGVYYGISEALVNDYPKAIKFTHTLIPGVSEQGPAHLNTVVTLSAMCENADVTNIVNKEALEQVCKNLGRQAGPNDMAYVMGKFAADLSAPQRYKGLTSQSLKKLMGTLVPYPRVKFIFANYVPNIDPNLLEKLFVPSLFKNCNRLLTCEPGHGKYLMTHFIFRGNFDNYLVDMGLKQRQCERSFQCVDFNPTAISSNYVKTTGSTGESAILLSNNSVISERFKLNCEIFDEFYSNTTGNSDSYFNNLQSIGIEKGLFSDARENLASLVKDYEEVTVESEE